MMVRSLALAALLVGATGCSTPSALAPGLVGSVGVPHSGFLTGAKELPAEGKGFKWKSSADHHWGLPRLVGLIEEAAGNVDTARPGTKPLQKLMSPSSWRGAIPLKV